MPPRRPLAPAALLVLALASPCPVRAQDARPVEARYGARADQLVVELDLRSALQGEVAAELTDGLTHQVRITMRLLPLAEDGRVREEAALRVRVRRCDIVFDLWSERFGVTLKRGERVTREAYEGLDAAVQTCAHVRSVPLVPLAALDLRRRYVVDAVVELDPPEAAEEAEGADYVGDPLGHRRPDSGGRTIFGAVAGIFTRDAPRDEHRRWHFRAAPFGQTVIQRVLEAAAAGGGQAP